MSSREQAWDDQAEAATAALDRLADRIRAQGNVTDVEFNRTPRGAIVIRERFNKFMNRGPGFHEIPCCRHLSGRSPQPVLWRAWDGRQLVCMDRDAHPAPPEPENSTCDACGRYSPKTLQSFGKQVNYVLVTFGLCAECRRPVE